MSHWERCSENSWPAQGDVNHMDVLNTSQRRHMPFLCVGFFDKLQHFQPMQHSRHFTA